MGDKAPVDSVPSEPRSLVWILLAVLIGSVAYLFYGRGLGSAAASWKALFVVPMAIGGLLSLAIGSQTPWSPLGCFLWPTLWAVTLIGLAWLLWGEGAVCIAMVLPLWIAGAIGGAVVNSILLRHWRRADGSDPTRLNAFAWLALPGVLLTVESANPPQWEEVRVTRSVEIAAPPEQIWPLLVQTGPIAASEGRGNFTQDVLGIARPRDARVVRRDGVYVRLARWGQGISFEEKLDRIVPGKQLGWSFAFPNDTLQQVTDRHISPQGPVLSIDRGGYRLEPIAPGRTRLVLETTYRMRSRLGGYLKLWGERMLGDIQANVLTVIRDKVEVRGKAAA